MAEAEAPQFTSLSQRIAALKQSQDRDSNGASTIGKKPPPPPPRPVPEVERPQLDLRSKTVNNPPIASFGSSVSRRANNEPAGAKNTGVLPPPPVDRDMVKATPTLPSRKGPPPLPGRKSSQQSPNLPPRKSSGQLVVRRGSNDSLMSQNSTISSISVTKSIASMPSSVDTCTGRKLPPALHEADLPPLPPTKRELEEQANRERQARLSIVSTKSSPAVSQIEWKKTNTIASPPRLPSRPNKPTQAEVASPVPVTRRLPPNLPPPMPQRPTLVPRPNHTTASDNEPPPIPYASRPSQKPIAAHKSAPVPRSTSECLICRDYSRSDKLAAQYPRLSNPDNSTDYLAEVLCGPLDSPTDKARAIFTWLHYNIDYDTEAFFGNDVKHSTPENTIARGLAVCGGYAGVFVAVALKAGLECVMVTGHGKGYGYSQPKDGSRVPPRNPNGHAWNAVRIDHGEWKLVDPCWGAGNVGNQKYNRKFSPGCFTASNEDFGLKHFPADDRYFFRGDGRSPTWEEYIAGPISSEPVQLCDVEVHGINRTSFLPPQKAITVNSSGTTRFQFSKMCLHWDHVKNGAGPPYCMVLKINGLDGIEGDWVPFDYDGTYWWVDVVTKHLGTPPQTVHAYAVTSVSGKDVRGMSKKEYLSRKGREGMGFGSIATWELV
jgi:transglutaminase-like putative cysteine protease